MKIKLLLPLLFIFSMTVHASPGDDIWIDIKRLYTLADAAKRNIQSLKEQINQIPEGKQGAPGPKGEQGLQGVQGEKGLSGPVGLEGKQGAPGLQGEQGPQGVQGEKGLVGPIGPEGKQGTPGLQGEQGPQGIQGEKGLVGSIGPEGKQGAPGLQGEQGPQGIQGEKGLVGSIGPEGKQGAPGLQGEQGPQGIQGGMGSQGDTGPSGQYVAGEGITIEGDIIKAVQQKHQIGETYRGGLVFYVDESGQHGLIASKIDVNEQGIQWRNGVSGNKVTNARGDGIGSGETNTRLIIAQQTIDNQKGLFAALLASNFQVLEDGITPCKTPIAAGSVCYGGWYLPSAFELQLLHKNLHQNNLSSFAPELYWSSTEASVSNAWLINFSSGEITASSKSNTMGRVRTVSQF